MRHNDDGYTLIELMLVITIIGILVTISIPSLLGFRARASDGRIQANLTSVAKAEAGHNVVSGAYTDDVGILDSLIPEIELGNAADDSIRIVLGDVNPDDDNQVLLYARSASGRWIGIKLVAIGAGSGRFTCIGNAEADMTIVDCNGSQW